MGDLPNYRVCESYRPFVNTGIDYAGPIIIRESHRRGRILTTKAYIAVFVCMATKSVHLELVSDLTTESFLPSLDRFSARRGKPTHIYSDNATTFVGADNSLKEIYKFLQANNNQISETLANKQIQWHFIPPRAPHFGSLWEATVKSMKRHFIKTTQNNLLTFEECYTHLTGIEACLNSRPLVPLSTDTHDLTALTRSHFLIGDSLVLPVETEYSGPMKTRWLRLKQLRQYFWRRWHKEYLQTLQTRTKWLLHSENIRIGTMVLIMDENTAPLKWKLARIEELCPGEDGIVRVVILRTSNGTLRRPVAKLCALPINEDEPKENQETKDKEV